MKVCSIGDFEHYCHLATATWLLHKFCVNPVVLKVFNKRPILFKKKIVIIIIKKKTLIVSIKTEDRFAWKENQMFIRSFYCDINGRKMTAKVILICSYLR